MFHQAEYGLVRERLVDMRAEVERERLGARLRKARKEREETEGATVFSEGLIPRRRSVLGRSAAFAAALFR
jgi:hypothetical protein